MSYLKDLNGAVGKAQMLRRLVGVQLRCTMPGYRNGAEVDGVHIPLLNATTRHA